VGWAVVQQQKSASTNAMARAEVADMVVRYGCRCNVVLPKKPEPIYLFAASHMKSRGSLMTCDNPNSAKNMEDRCRPRPVIMRPPNLLTRVRRALFGENFEERLWREKREFEEQMRVEDCKWTIYLERRPF
jgi:hypothetical protein